MTMLTTISMSISMMFPCVAANAAVKEYQYAGYSMFGDELILIYNTGAKFNDAEEYAQSIGGHLISIDSAEETEAVVDLMKSSGTLRGYHLGLRRDATDKTIWNNCLGQSIKVIDGKWTNIATNEEVYTNWVSGEPNNTSEDTAMIYNNDNNRGRWNDERDGTSCYVGTYGFIVEIDTANYCFTKPISYNGHSYVCFDGNSNYNILKLYMSIKNIEDQYPAFAETEDEAEFLSSTFGGDYTYYLDGENGEVSGTKGFVLEFDYIDRDNCDHLYNQDNSICPYCGYLSTYNVELGEFAVGDKLLEVTDTDNDAKLNLEYEWVKVAGDNKYEAVTEDAYEKDVEYALVITIKSTDDNWVDGDLVLSLNGEEITSKEVAETGDYKVVVVLGKASYTEPEVSPEITPENTPEVTPEATPEITPEVVVTPEATPEATPEITTNPITPKPTIVAGEEITPTAAPTTAPTAVPTVAPELNVGDFVQRCYKIALGRDADEGGYNYWVDSLNNGEACGAQVGFGFIFSEEYSNKNTNDKDFITDLYNMFFGREADDLGFAYWMDCISEGYTREEVFAGFANSIEFYNLCTKYGVVSGYYLVGVPNSQQGGINCFVARLYKVCLNRLPDMEGQAGWVLKLYNGEVSGTRCSYGFVFSPEFIGKNPSNEDFVNYMYAAFFGREADEAGFTAWVDVLNGNGAYEDVFTGFSGSAEFFNLCADYGIQA